jgi:hypothetical protein
MQSDKAFCRRRNALALARWRAKHRDRLQGLISTVQIKGAACIRRCS